MAMDHELFKFLCAIIERERGQGGVAAYLTVQESAVIILYVGTHRVVLHKDGTWEFKA